MSKFIGEMSYEDFKEALHSIIFDKLDSQTKEEISENKKSLKEKLKEDIKYIITFGIIKDCWILLKDCYNLFKYAFSKQCFVDIKNKLTSFFYNLADDTQKKEEPLTKELFIKKGKKYKESLLDLLDTVIFVVVMVIIIRFCIGEIRWIPSGSMHPTLLEGDRIFVERYSRFYATPQRGDIMVFYPPSEPLNKTPWKIFSRLTGFFCKDIAYIKRVIALPGEKFELKVDNNGKYTVYINDKALDEPYIVSPYDYKPCTESMACGPFTLGDNQYMMLGDNRGDSLDSRYWGPLNQNRFIGKAVYLFWPFNRVKTLLYKK